MIMTRHRPCAVILFLVLIFPHRVFCYEKTLRKIVRNQSKMVQRPFSDTGGQTWSWNNQSKLPQLPGAIIAPGFTQTKVLHRVHRPKMSTILSSMESERGKSAQTKLFSGNNILALNDFRMARNTLSINDRVLQPFTGNEYYIDQKQRNNSPVTNIAIETYSYRIPSGVKFFPPMEDRELQFLEQKNSKELTVVFPENIENKENGSLHLKSIFMAYKNNSDRIDDIRKSKLQVQPEIKEADTSDADNNKADYLLHGNPVDIEVMYGYNASVNPYVCKTLKEAHADIDAQKTFAAFDIEPPWVQKKHYWNNIFDSRYESLMRSVKWPPLKVILVPRTHVDSIWKKSFEHYHNDSVSKILGNMVKKMQFYTNMTFTWNEISHLSRWWKNTSYKSRVVFKKLVKSGRLEITTGGWVEPDEATSHIFGLVHQLIEGHEWLKNNLNYAPKVAWLTNSVTHSPTMAYLLSTLDIYQLVLTNLHFSWEQFLAEYQYSDFIWVQNWDSDKSITDLNEALNTMGTERHLKHSVMTHYLQFNSAGFKACGPKKAICSSEFNFAKSFKNLDINTYNVKEKSELLLEQYSKSGTITPHNIIIAPIGAPYSYEGQAEFDYQYNNYQKIAEFVNVNREIYKATIEFGTPQNYFELILSQHRKYPTVKGDFLNFADLNSGTPAYWTGFYTSRPYFKILLRRLESAMRSTEILFSFALTLNAFRNYNESNIFETLIKCRENFALLMDRNVASGTLPVNVLRYAQALILTTVKDCWHIQKVAASLLTSKPGNSEPYLQKYVYREGKFFPPLKTVSAEDQVYVFNSLSHERTEVIELVSRQSNIRIVDYSRKEVTIQINPVWKYTSSNLIMISRRFFKIIFTVTVPPMTLELFRIKTTYDATQSAATIYCSSCKVHDAPECEATFPFAIQPVQTGDIQLESYKHRLIFDEQSGFLKTIVEKETNIAKSVVIDFGAFRDVDVNSGMFLFNTNVSKPLKDILMPYRVGSKKRISMIISGQIRTEMSTIFGRFLQHTIKIYNLVQSPLANAIHIETKVDYEVSPKNRDLELFMSIQTDIANGVSPQIYIDNNGFQHTARTVNLSKRIESNMYPISSLAYIQDQRRRLTYITDHAQGLTALQEGQLVVMLDRRVLFNDGRGVNEGLADSSATCHNQFILLENFRDNTGGHFTPHDLSLPSLSAVYLANTLNYPSDIFLVNQNDTDHCRYGFLPLIKTSFPCDVSVINFRLVLVGGSHQRINPNTALLILHRRSFSCRVDISSQLRCNGETGMSLDKILRNVKAVYQTNLAGTNKGTPLFNFSPANFPPMEIVTLRIYF